MDMRGKAIRAIKIESQENCLQEKGEPFCCEGKTDNPSRVSCKDRPEQAHLKLDNSAGNRANREQDNETSRPLASQCQPGCIFAPESQRMRHAYENRKADPQHRKDNVETKRKPHLTTSRQQVSPHENLLQMPCKAEKVAC